MYGRKLTGKNNSVNELSHSRVARYQQLKYSITVCHSALDAESRGSRENGNPIHLYSSLLSQSRPPYLIRGTAPGFLLPQE